MMNKKIISFYKRIVINLCIIMALEMTVPMNVYAINEIENLQDENEYLDIDEYIKNDEISGFIKDNEELTENIIEDDINISTQTDTLKYTPNPTNSYMDNYSFQHLTTKGYPLFAYLVIDNIGRKISKYGSLSNTSGKTELNNVNLNVLIDGVNVVETNNKNRVVISKFNNDQDIYIEFYLGNYKYNDSGKKDISFKAIIDAYDYNNKLYNIEIDYNSEVIFVDESSSSSERLYPNECIQLKEQFSEIELLAGDNIKIENKYLKLDLDNINETIRSVEMIKHGTTDVVATIPSTKYTWYSNNTKNNCRNLSTTYYSPDNNYYYDYYIGYLDISDFTVSKIEDNTYYDIVIKTSSGRIHRYEKTYKGMGTPFLKRIGVDNIFLEKNDIKIPPVLRNNYITAVIYGINFDCSSAPNFYTTDKSETVTEYDLSDNNCGYEEDYTGWYHYYTLRKKPGFDSSISEIKEKINNYNINDLYYVKYNAIIGFDYTVEHIDTSLFYEEFEDNRYCRIPILTGNGYSFMNYADSRGYIFLEKDFAQEGDIVEVTFPFISYKDFSYFTIAEKYSVKNENGDLYIHIGPSNKLWNYNNDSSRITDGPIIKNITKGTIKKLVQPMMVNDINDLNSRMEACSYWEVHNFYDVSSNVKISGSGKINEHIKAQISDNRIYRMCFKNSDDKIIGSTLFNISSNLENTDKPVVIEEDEEIIEDDYIVSGNSINVTLASKGKIKIDLLAKNGYGAWVLIDEGDKKIAKIGKNGVIAGRDVGKTTIKLNCNDKIYTVNITVENPLLPEKKIYINKGDTSKIEILNTNLKKKFISNKPSIVKVSNDGEIKGVSCGTAKIIITVGGKKLKLSVVVEDPKMQYDYVEIVNGKVSKLKILKSKSKPEWYSSNKNIVSVENGKLIPISTGTANVFANVNGRTLSCEVYVDNPEISKGQIVLNVGQKEYIKMNKTKFDYEWKTTNQEVAAVLTNGKVIGKSKGNAVIYTKINGRKYQCLVTVQ